MGRGAASREALAPVPRRRWRRSMRTLPRDLGRFKYILLGAAAILVVGIGCWGWMHAVPTLGVGEALYRSLALFTISMPEVTMNPALEVARWGAIVVAGLSLMSVARDAIRDVQLHRRIQEAKRARDHVVICGDGLEAVQLAHSFETSAGATTVVLVGAVPASRLPELRERHVVCLSGADDLDLAEILADARHVIVVAGSDQEAMAETARISRLLAEATPVTALFDDRDLAAQWNRTRRERAVSRPARVAMELLRLQEPFREDCVVPPPVIFGDSDVAVELARRIFTGWQEPGEHVEVHLVSSTSARLDAVQVGLEARGTVHFHPMASHPELAPSVLREILNRQHPIAASGSMATAGPRVYVAYRADELSVTVAAALAEQIPGAVVTGVVDDATPWESAGQVPGISAPHLISVGRLLTSWDAIEKAPVDLLADEILVDARRWPQEVPSILGTEDQARSVALEVAALAPTVLGAAGIETDSRVWPARLAPFLGPDELVIIADALAERSTTFRDADRALLLEFAARLPTLVARAGHTPDWQPDHGSLVTADDVAALAEAAHESYLAIAAHTANTTGSAHAGVAWPDLAPFARRANLAQTADIPLKLALCGLTWRRAENPEPFDFTPQELELLAEQEHRRWRHFQFRNGRVGGPWDVSWADLDEPVRDYDRHAVAAIPSALRTLGIEIARVATTPTVADPPRSSSGNGDTDASHETGQEATRDESR